MGELDRKHSDLVSGLKVLIDVINEQGDTQNTEYGTLTW